MSKPVDYHYVLKKLWQTWALCYGAVTALALAGWVVPHVWLPFVALGLMVPVFAFANRNMAASRVNCSLMIHYTIYVLAVAGAAMLLLNLINTKYFSFEFQNPKLPYVSTVIVYPAAAVFYWIGRYRRNKTSYCKECHQRMGYSVKDILECGVFRSEARFLIVFGAAVCTILAIVSALYTNIFYINTDINSPDTFFFFIVPAVVYALTLAYISMRFSSLHFEVTMAPSRDPSRLSSVVRFMVVRGDCVMLRELSAGDKGIGTFDTAASADVPFADELPDDEARQIFKRLSGIDDFVLRHLFRTSTSSHNAFHYAVFLPDDASAGKLQGEWFNLYQIDAMLKAGMICRPFAYEMHRVYTMTMAWKTYDREGNRLYPIKNYKPTFRIADFKDWDLDYSDMYWMNVASNNADRPFFKLRKFWRRYVTGSDNKWKRSNS